MNFQDKRTYEVDISQPFDNARRSRPKPGRPSLQPDAESPDGAQARAQAVLLKETCEEALQYILAQNLGKPTPR